ncbi:reverse transcriptase domain-containing protein [Tanacetum coccineum]
MDYTALRYLFAKQDAKPRLIRWILLLQKFNIKIRDKKGAENLAVDHLSRLKNPDLGKLTRAEIRDLFPEEQLMSISDGKEELASQILQQCHSGPLGGHHGIATIARKVYEAGYYWPNIFYDARKLGFDFMGLFPSSNENKCILVAVDYVSKWVEAQALHTSDARVVITFLRLYLIRRARKFFGFLHGQFLDDDLAKIICRKAHLLEDKQIPSAGVFDEA